MGPGNRFSEIEFDDVSMERTSACRGRRCTWIVPCSLVQACLHRGPPQHAIVGRRARCLGSADTGPALPSSRPFFRQRLAVGLTRQHRTRLRLSGAAGLLCVLLLGGMSSCNGPSGAPSGTYTVEIEITAGQFQLEVPVMVTVPK